MTMMADSNSYSSPFKLPRELELPMSTSACSLDVSVLSVDSSCSSFGSLTQASSSLARGSINSGSGATNNKPKVHKRKQSFAKYYKTTAGGSNNRLSSSRWNNTVDAFGSAGTNTAPFRKPSYPRLSNPKLNRMNAFDVAVNMPCRKCSRDSLNFSSKLAVDGPVPIPLRKESGESLAKPSILEGGATAALKNFHLRNSSTSSFSRRSSKNFEWGGGRRRSSTSSNGSGSGSSTERNARTFPPLVESVFSFQPPHDPSASKKKNPPNKPSRRGSSNIMEFNLLSSFECTCPDNQQQTAGPASSAMMPPPIPARKESLMDFEEAASESVSYNHGNNNQMLPPYNNNNNWGAPIAPTRKGSVTTMGGGSSHHHRDSIASRGGYSASNNMFLAAPSMTMPFERRSSGISNGSPTLPRRRGSLMMDDGVPLPPSFGRHESTATTHSSMTAPTLPQRKESLMSIADDTADDNNYR